MANTHKPKHMKTINEILAEQKAIADKRLAEQTAPRPVAENSIEAEPFGYAFHFGNQIVICGTPNDIEDENDPLYHNCDAMGCGQNHVLYRFDKEGAL